MGTCFIDVIIPAKFSNRIACMYEIWIESLSFHLERIWSLTNFFVAKSSANSSACQYFIFQYCMSNYVDALSNHRNSQKNIGVFLHSCNYKMVVIRFALFTIRPLWWLDLNLLSGPDALQKDRSWNLILCHLFSISSKKMLFNNLLLKASRGPLSFVSARGTVVEYDRK